MFKSLIRISTFVKPNVAFGKNVPNSYLFKPMVQPNFQLKAMRFTTETENETETSTEQTKPKRRYNQKNKSNNFKNNDNNGGFNRERQPRQYNSRESRTTETREVQHKNIIIVIRETPSKEEVLRALGDATPENLFIQQSPDGDHYAFLTFENTTAATQAIGNLRLFRKENPKFGNFRCVSDEDIEKVKSEIQHPSSYVKFYKLPYTISPEELTNHLSEYDIQEITVSNASGVVKFSSHEEAVRVVKEKAGVTIYNSMRLNPSMAIPSDFEFLQNNQSRTVRVRNIPYESKHTDIRTLFEELPISRVVMIPSVKDQGVTGAFVEFGTAEDALKALEKSQTTLGSRVITVNRSSPKEQKHVSRKVYELIKQNKVAETESQ